jgi:glycosyltransferase involved in cell wall biosynthesis
LLRTEKVKICALGALYHGDKPKYLHDCLKSLRSQTLKIPLILVVDGPISIQLEEVLVLFDDLDMRLIRNAKNQGLSTALQLALNCIGDEFEYAIRFDADDINADRRFEVTRDYLLMSDVDLVSCHMKEIDANGTVFSARAVPIGADRIRKKLPYRNPINHPAAAFRVSSVLAVGGYQEMPFFEDWYLWTRMFKAGFEIANIDDYLVSFRATDDMVARRFGLGYMKHEANFFLRRSKENLINPFENWFAWSIRFCVKIFGFGFYKKIFYLIRR